MKRILTLLFSVVAFSAAALAQANIKFEATSADLGTFDENEVKTCTFTFTNTGNEPLVIHQAFSSCGCTVPSVPKEAIQPGEKGEIKVTYNGKGKFPGAFKKPVTVRTNAQNSVVRLYIQGTMTVNGKVD